MLLENKKGLLYNGVFDMSLLFITLVVELWLSQVGSIYLYLTSNALLRPVCYSQNKMFCLKILYRIKKNSTQKLARKYNTVLNMSGFRKITIFYRRAC